MPATPVTAIPQRHSSTFQAPPPLTVHSSRPALARPWQLLLSIAANLRDGRELAWRLAWRNLDALYRNTILGYLWLVLPSAVTATLFIALHSNGSFAAPVTSFPYPVFVISSLLLWQCFADGFLAPLRMLRQNLTLLPRLRISGEALLLGALMESLIQSTVRGGLIVAALVFFHSSLSFTLWLAGPALVALVFTGFSLGIVVAPVAVLLPDAERTITLALPLWMLASGVVTSAPEHGAWGGLLAWNPATILHFARFCFLGPTSVMSYPKLQSIVFVLGVACALSLTAITFFRVSLPHLSARIAA